MSLAALDSWSIAAARAGLQSGAGPFWDASQLCGRPLFGVWGLPWSSPVALLLLELGPWPLWALAAIGTALLWAQGPRRAWTLVAALAALAAFSTMPCGFVAALALAPWALLLFWRAPLSAAVAMLALFLSALSPLLSFALLGLAYLEREQPLAWLQRLGWALLLCAPAWLPLFFRSSVVLERGRLWLLAPPSEWLAALAWVCVTRLLGAPKKPGLWAGLGGLALAGMLALSLTPAASAPGFPLQPLRFNQVYSRYLDSQGSPEALARASAALTAQASLVGSLDGRGSAPALQRWQRLVTLGVREPDLLSLSNVGWFAGYQDGQGGRLNGPVALALVDGAMAEGDLDAQWTGVGLFQRPLKVAGLVPATAPGSTWHLLTPQDAQAGRSQAALPAGHAGGWIFFSQSYDAGWHAQVLDGQGKAGSRAIAKTEGGFMAIPVESGARSVLFQFKSPLFWVGLLLSFVGLGLLSWKERLFLLQTR